MKDYEQKTIPNSRIFQENERQLLEEIMTFRRDVRGNHFTDETIDDKTIKQLLSVASISPSVGFSQPWEFVIIRDKKLKTTIIDSYHRERELEQQTFDTEKQQAYKQLKLEGILEAPVNIAVFHKPSSEPVLGQHSMPEMGEYSVVCAIQNIWLMARAMNIGIGWVSILNPVTVKETLDIPESFKLVAYLCVGRVNTFLSEPELQTLGWKKRINIDDVMHLNRYKNNC